MAGLFGMLLIFSLIGLVVGEVLARSSQTHFQGSRVRRFARLGTIGFFVLWLFSLSFQVVPAGHRGVVFNRITGVQDKVLGEGLNIVMPFVAHVEPISVRTNKLSLDLEAVTRDLQQMKFTVVVNYRPIAADLHKLYKEVGTSYVDVVLVPALNEIVKTNTSKYKADDILEKRQEIKLQIMDAVTRSMQRYHLVIDDVTLSNVRFSPEFEKAIEEKQVAEQLAKKKEYELDMAQKDAEIAQTRARGEAEAQKIKLLAEAEANRALDASLSERILKYRLQMAYIEKLSDKIEVMVVPSDAVPLMNLGDIFKK